MFWKFKKKQQDFDDPIRVAAFNKPRKTFGEPIAKATGNQKKKWAKLRLPTKESPEAWNDKAKKSHESIIGVYQKEPDKLYHLCTDYNCPDKGKPVEEAHT